MKGLYLTGSILTNHAIEINDVDIIHELEFTNKQDAVEFAQDIFEIQKRFFEKFFLPLHVTSFTQNEKDEMKIFLSKNVYIKLI